MSLGIIGNDKKNNLLNMTKKNKYYDQTYCPKLDNVNDSHSFICKNIKRNSKVLDLGCSQGLIGIILKEELDCVVYGVDTDKEALDIAKQTNCYEEIYNFDVTDINSDEYKSFFETDFCFDYIVFSDVLEHLRSPAEVLYNFGKKLKYGGKVLISLPNIAHYDIIRGLLDIKFNYSDMGLLDSTHLRFFTKYSFVDYLDSANQKMDFKYDCFLVNQTITDFDFKEDYPNIFDILNKNNELRVLQNIFMLTKIPKEEDTINIQKILSEERVDLINEFEDKLDIVKDVHMLEARNNQLESELTRVRDDLDYLYNEYNKMLCSRSWKITKPIRKLNSLYNKFIVRINAKRDYKKSVLMLVHTWINIYDKNITNIGGTTNHVIDLIKNSHGFMNVYVLTIINDKYMLVVFDGDEQYIYDLNVKVKSKYYDTYDFEFNTLLNSLITNLNIDILHMHHLLGFPCDLQYIPSTVKKIMTVHDYFMICARYFLIDCNDKCCLDRTYEKCRNCISNNKMNLSVKDTAVKNLVKRIDKFIVPDESVANELIKHFDLENYEVIPHGINFDEFSKFDISLKNQTKKKNIAFVGFINGHKGLKHMRDLVKNNDDSNIVYHLFGSTTDEFLNSNQDNYVNHGIYNRKDLPRLLNENNIDLVLLLSTCVESFSYALSEVLYAQVPCLVFNIGALGNRVEKDGLGWVIDKDSTYKDIIEIYSDIFEESEYNRKLANIAEYSGITIDKMVDRVLEIYDEMYVPSKKDYLKIYEYMQKYYLKYKI